MNKHGKKSPSEDEDIKSIVTRPSISRNFSPIGRNIEIPQIYRFSERKPYNYWKSRGQNDLSYYQPQPANYNQCQQYPHYRRTQQSTSRNDYDREKW